MSKYAEIGFKVLDCGIVLPNFDAHGLDQVKSGSGSKTGKADGTHFQNKKDWQFYNYASVYLL